MIGRHTLEARISSIFADHLNRPVADPQADLFESGLLDSLAFVDLLMHLEEAFGIRIDTEDFEIDRFRSIARIAGFVESRRQSGEPPRETGALVDA